jgi:hypothetical protein
VFFLGGGVVGVNIETTELERNCLDYRGVKPALGERALRVDSLHSTVRSTTRVLYFQRKGKTGSRQVQKCSRDHLENKNDITKALWQINLHPGKTCGFSEMQQSKSYL